ncbi:hypothetical protein B0O99DRAFT_726862 [Bisporella sp. PMI_857]|nr:hypothetical protein B0O99DRAFT_726862 [Bisporella sp. PMI_857]
MISVMRYTRPDPCNQPCAPLLHYISFSSGCKMDSVYTAEVDMSTSRFEAPPAYMLSEANGSSQIYPQPTLFHNHTMSFNQAGDDMQHGATLVRPSQVDPSDVHQTQIDYFTRRLDEEIAGHNETRVRLNSILRMSLHWERLLCQEKAKSLNLAVANDALQLRLQETTLKLCSFEAQLDAIKEDVERRNAESQLLNDTATNTAMKEHTPSVSEYTSLSLSPSMESSTRPHKRRFASPVEEERSTRMRCSTPQQTNFSPNTPIPMAGEGFDRIEW